MVINGVYIHVEIIDILKELRQETGLFNDINDVGDDLMVTCPKHSGGQEENPSCGILKEDKYQGEHLVKAGTVHCYTCNYVNDIIGLIQDVKGYQRPQNALQWLITKFTTKDITTNKRPPIKLNLSRETYTPEDTLMPNNIVYRNNYNFRNNKEAINYMKNRKLSEKLCNKFKIGYNITNRTIMIPITQGGKVRFYKERGIDRKIFLNQKGKNKANYIFGLDQAIQNYKNDPKLKVWICESEIDALTIYEWGGTAIAIMGSHISNRQIQLLLNSPIRHIIDGFDRDKAGRKGFYTFQKRTLKYGIRTYKTNWKGINKKDINELNKKEFEIILDRLENK